MPAGFIAHPSDLDGLLLFLASNKASRYVTGASIAIDGGMSFGEAVNQRRKMKNTTKNVVLVTGASFGIGEALVRELISQRYDGGGTCSFFRKINVHQK